MKTVALIGAGAVGAYFIWGMQDALGADFCVVAQGERKTRLERDGLWINDRLYHPLVKTPEAAHGVDLLLVSTKYGALSSILPDIAAVVDDHTAVISLLNGVDSEEIIGGYIGMEHMLYAVMRIAAERDQNRIFFDPEATQGVYFGEAHHQSPTPRVQEVSDLLARTRVHHQFFPDILTTLWVKFAGNVSNNLPQAILGAGVGIYLVSTHAAFIAQKMWDEVARLAQTKGIDVGPFEPEAWAGRKNARFSTLQDLDHKRHTEVDMLAGTVIRLSQEAGLAAPYCTFAYHAIKALEEKNDGRFDFDTMC